MRIVLSILSAFDWVLGFICQCLIAIICFLPLLFLGEFEYVPWKPIKFTEIIHVIKTRNEPETPHGE